MDHLEAFPEKPYHPHWPLAACVFALIFLLGLFSIHEPSTWIQIKVGEKILTEGHLPRTDPFSYGAADAPWTTHSWLADVLFYKLDALGGPALLTFCKSAVIAVAFALMLPINTGSPLVAASILSAAACAAWSGLAETPFAFDFLFFSLFLRLLRPRHRFRLIDAVYLTGLTALWANIHGASAPLGPWLVGLKVFKTTMRTSARERMSYWGMLVACALSFSWNPHGFGILSHVFCDAASPLQSLNAPLASPIGFFLAAGAVACWMILQQEFVLTLAAATVIALAVVLPGFRPLSVLAVSPVLALAIGQRLPPWQDTSRRVLAWAALAFVFMAAHIHAIATPLKSLGGYGLPKYAGVMRYLEANAIRGRMFNLPETGAELIGLTKRKVFSDSREALYPSAFRHDVGDWTRMFRSLDAIYHFDYVVLVRRGNPDPMIDHIPEWRLAYADEQGLVYLKTTGANSHVRLKAP